MKWLNKEINDLTDTELTDAFETLKAMADCRQNALGHEKFKALKINEKINPLLQHPPKEIANPAFIELQNVINAEIEKGKVPMAEKSAADIEREKIVVTTTNEPEKVDEVVEEVTTEEEQSVEEVVEGKKEEIAASEKTEEELEAEKKAAETAAEKAKIQKRIDREVAKRKTLEEENAELKRQLNAKKEEGEIVLTEEDVEKKSEEKANAKVLQKEFDDNCNKLAIEAEKIDKDFQANVKELSVEVSPIPGIMIGILTDLENGGAVLAHLAKDHDEAERLFKLPPAKMAVETTKLAMKLLPKPVVKPVSKVPPPIDTIAANGRTTTKLHDKMSDHEWIEKRNAELAEKRAKGLVKNI